MLYASTTPRGPQKSGLSRIIVRSVEPFLLGVGGRDENAKWKEHSGCACRSVMDDKVQIKGGKEERVGWIEEVRGINDLLTRN